MVPQRILTSALLASEFEFATSRSSGPGGQNVNKAIKHQGYFALEH